MINKKNTLIVLLGLSVAIIGYQYYQSKKKS
jgi:hypothetical protein